MKMNTKTVTALVVAVALASQGVAAQATGAQACENEMISICGAELAQDNEAVMQASVRECLGAAQEAGTLSTECGAYLSDSQNGIDKLVDAAKVQWEKLGDGARVVGGHIENAAGEVIDGAKIVGGHIVDAGGNIIDGAKEVHGQIVNASGEVIEGAKKVGGHIVDAAGDVIDGAKIVGGQVVDKFGKVLDDAKVVGGHIVDGAGQIIDDVEETAGKIKDTVWGWGRKTWNFLSRGTRACKEDKLTVCPGLKSSQLRVCFNQAWKNGELSELCTSHLDGKERRQNDNRNN